MISDHIRLDRKETHIQDREPSTPASQYKSALSEDSIGKAVVTETMKIDLVTVSAEDKGTQEDNAKKGSTIFVQISNYASWLYDSIFGTSDKTVPASDDKGGSGGVVNPYNGTPRLEPTARTMMMDPESMKKMAQGLKELSYHIQEISEEGAQQAGSAGENKWEKKDDRKDYEMMIRCILAQRDIVTKIALLSKDDVFKLQQKLRDNDLEYFEAKKASTEFAKTARILGWVGTGVNLFVFALFVGAATASTGGSGTIAAMKVAGSVSAAATKAFETYFKSYSDKKNGESVRMRAEREQTLDKMGSCANRLKDGMENTARYLKMASKAQEQLHEATQAASAA